MESAKLELRGFGNGPHALYCRNGDQINDEHLPEGTEVEDATENDKVHVPTDPKRVAGDDDNHVLSLAGIFIIPGKGVAALYGCEAIPIIEWTDE